MERSHQEYDTSPRVILQPPDLQQHNRQGQAQRYALHAQFLCQRKLRPDLYQIESAFCLWYHQEN